MDLRDRWLPVAVVCAMVGIAGGCAYRAFDPCSEWGVLCEAQPRNQPLSIARPVLDIQAVTCTRESIGDNFRVQVDVKNAGPCTAGDHGCDLPLDPALTVLGVPVSFTVDFEVTPRGETIPQRMTNGWGHFLDNGASATVYAGGFGPTATDAVVTARITQVSGLNRPVFLFHSPMSVNWSAATQSCSP